MQNMSINFFSAARGLSDTAMWIGLSDETIEGSFVWTDGIVATYTDWLRASRPNGGKKENCVVLYRGGWEDISCELRRKFVCELWH